MNPLKWWARRTLRLRVTATATLVLAIGLVLGTTVLSSLFFHSRVKVVDQTVHAELATVAPGDFRRVPAPFLACARRNRVRTGSRRR